MSGVRVLQDDQRCILEDELTDVLEAIRKADTLVLASPVYFGDIRGRLECFFDRTYSYLNPDFSSRLPSGKNAVFILVQGEPEEDQFNDIFPRYAHWLKLFGFFRFISSGPPVSEPQGI
jgi:multimeric flavodoxin WrbA